MKKSVFQRAAALLLALVLAVEGINTLKNKKPSETAK